MNILKYILLLFWSSLIAQSSITAKLQSKKPLKADILVDIDNFDTQYITLNNEFYQNTLTGGFTYSNVQFGAITSANVFNPLKINLFYSDFNSAIILDNRLAEITKIDFNTLQPFRVATHISTGNDNTIWIYNQNTQQLELFDYITNKSRVKTLPISGLVLDLKSDFNFCWLLTKEHLFVYNYFGSLIEKFPNEGFTKIEENNGDLFLLKDNSLYFKAKNSSKTEPIELPGLLINQFLVTNETLYIYADEMLHQFQLKTN